eukprot:scaffold58044_cov63-Phaeocystis_antarctica.AAC.2
MPLAPSISTPAAVPAAFRVDVARCADPLSPGSQRRARALLIFQLRQKPVLADFDALFAARAARAARATLAVLAATLAGRVLAVCLAVEHQPRARADCLRVRQQEGAALPCELQRGLLAQREHRVGLGREQQLDALRRRRHRRRVQRRGAVAIARVHLGVGLEQGLGAARPRVAAREDERRVARLRDLVGQRLGSEQQLDEVGAALGVEAAFRNDPMQRRPPERRTRPAAQPPLQHARESDQTCRPAPSSVPCGTLPAAPCRPAPRQARGSRAGAPVSARPWPCTYGWRPGRTRPRPWAGTNSADGPPCPSRVHRARRACRCSGAWAARPGWRRSPRPSISAGPPG